LRKLNKIEAPSPTLAKKLKNRKAKFELIPEDKFNTVKVEKNEDRERMNDV